MQSDILYRIRSNHDQLSETERKVADAILDDIGFAAAANIQELAAKAGVSIATVSRYVRALGCADIRELKLQLAHAGAVGARFLQPADVNDGAIENAEDAFYQRICRDAEEAMRAHLGAWRPALFRQASEHIRAARMVYLFGVGGASTMLSDELQFRLVRLGLPVAAYHDAVLMRMTAATVGPQDCVVMLSVSGHSPELLDVAATVAQYGAGLIAMTDPDSPLAAKAQIVLPFKTAETDFIFKPSASRYAMLLGIDILATEIALGQQARSQDLLRRVKLTLDAYRGGPDRLPLGD
jgi:DNA-binding MurR/RpiR family transcriptional regulator